MLYLQACSWWHHKDHGSISHITLSSIREPDCLKLPLDIEKLSTATARLLARKHWLYYRGCCSSWRGILHLKISQTAPSVCLYGRQTCEPCNKGIRPVQSDIGFRKGSSHRQPSIWEAEVQGKHHLSSAEGLRIHHKAQLQNVWYWLTYKSKQMLTFQILVQDFIGLGLWLLVCTSLWSWIGIGDNAAGVLG